MLLIIFFVHRLGLDSGKINRLIWELYVHDIVTIYTVSGINMCVTLHWIDTLLF